MGDVSYDAFVPSSNLPLPFRPRKDVSEGSDDGSSNEYTREHREGAEGYCCDDS